MQQFPDISQCIEKTTVMSFKIYWNDIPFILFGTLNEILLPFQVLYLPFAIYAL